MVPNGWEVTTLGEHVDISSGYSPSKYVLAESGSFPFVKVEDMNNCEKYQSISRTYTETNGSPIGKGAVIFPKRGAAIMNNKVRITDVPMYLDTNMMALTPKKSVFYEYLYYTLIKEELHKIADTSTIPQINNKHILPYRFKLPPLPEQRKIAKILSTWDKAISTTEKLIETSKQQKKALMQQLLTGNKRLVNTETGKAFEGEWKFSQFNELYKVANNKATQVKSGEYLESGRTPIVDQGKSIVGGYTNNEITYKDLPVIVFGDHTRIVKWVDFEFAQGADGTQVLKSHKSMDEKFAYYILLNTDIPNLGYSRHMRELKERDFKYPISKVEQQKIASVLTSVDKEIEVLEAKLAHLKLEKKALMQQLLTGKRRVSLSS